MRVRPPGDPLLGPGTAAPSAGSPTDSGEPSRVLSYGTKLDGSTDKERFDRWYGNPLRALGGDGGFIAMAVCCALYERFIIALRKADSPGATEHSFRYRCICEHFGLEYDGAQNFWQVMRGGLLHQGMPMTKTGLPRWRFCNTLPKPVIVNTETGDLEVHPFRFRDKVLDLYEKRPELISTSKSFAWAGIYS